MKKLVPKLGVFLLVISLFYSCGPTDKPVDQKFPYTLEITETELKNAPPLQSFAHAKDGNEWLLFAGRTNTIDPDKKDNDDGGLHNMNANYADESFPPTSFNEDIFVYNIASDAVPESISFQELQTIVAKNFPSYSAILEEFKAVFKNTNSQVKQVGDFMYLVGGYGAANWSEPKKQYLTYNHVAQIHVPSLISLVKGDFDAVNKDSIFAFTKGVNLTATGGEIQTIGEGDNMKLYLVGGHNFTSTTQKYQDAVYPFKIKKNPTQNKDSIHYLVLEEYAPISDVSDPTDPASDDISTMRRRDGPILPQLFKSPGDQDGVEQGFAFFAGVFKPGDNPLEAWNDAVYIHPNFANAESKLYTLDTAYNQKNYNVYSSPYFVIYDKKTATVHSFLMGGIGDGKTDPKGNLSGFTNTAMHIETSVDHFKSDCTLIGPENLFNKKNKNVPNFYGAEAIFFNSIEIPLYKLGKVETELIDMSKLGNGDVVVGHIFGGIESFESNPASYGPSKSRASNKIFKVTLKRK